MVEFLAYKMMSESWIQTQVCIKPKLLPAIPSCTERSTYNDPDLDGSDEIHRN